jgi:F-type H+-transporting ATPase subunit b
MHLLPMDIGPLNPVVAELVVAAGLFALVFLFFVRTVPRVQRVLDEREAATTEAEAAALRAEIELKRAEVAQALAEARHESARIRQRAHEEGAALIAGARADAHRACADLLAEGHARLTEDRATAEAELRAHAHVLARDLAGRIVGEPVGETVRPRP